MGSVNVRNVLTLQFKNTEYILNGNISTDVF